MALHIGAPHRWWQAEERQHHSVEKRSGDSLTRHRVRLLFPFPTHPCCPAVSGREPGSERSCALVRKHLYLLQWCLRTNPMLRLTTFISLRCSSENDIMLTRKITVWPVFCASVSQCDQGLFWFGAVFFPPQLYLAKWRHDCSMLGCLNLTGRGDISSEDAASSSSKQLIKSLETLCIYLKVCCYCSNCCLQGCPEIPVNHFTVIQLLLSNDGAKLLPRYLFRFLGGFCSLSWVPCCCGWGTLVLGNRKQWQCSGWTV